MTPTETPHPLAVEAAEKISNRIGEYGDYEATVFAPIIHTTALEPVIKAGDELWEEFRDFAGQNKCGCGHPACSRCRDDRYAAKALTQWRTLTSPETGDSTPLEGSPSGFEG